MKNLAPVLLIALAAALSCTPDKPDYNNPLDPDGTNYQVPAKPVLAAGITAVSDSAYTLTWKSAARAKTYILSESASSDFKDATEKTLSDTVAVLSHTVLKQPAKYYYRVKGRNGDYQGEWSDAASVTVSPRTYKLTGSITGADGVTVTLSGDRSETQTVNSGGTYSFSVYNGGSYTVTLLKSGYMFIPASKAFSGVTTNESQDFAGKIILIINDITFVSLPGGTFQMGDVENSGGSDETPAHSVTITGFDMGIHEVTNAQYCAYLNAALASGDIELKSGDVYGMTGSWSEQKYLDIGYGSGQNMCWITYSGNAFSVISGKENWPVVAVTWYGSKAFALYYGLDLPTEAEWEYACRGGRQYKYGTDDGTISSSKANYYQNGPNYPKDVGVYPANLYGLYDMSGNVSEWCHDWYGSYTATSQNNPAGVQLGASRLVRGGSWGSNVNNCRSAYRDNYTPDSRFNHIGFRVVRRLSPQNY